MKRYYADSDKMWPTRAIDLRRIIDELHSAKAALGLVGLEDERFVKTLAMQFVASLRREDYYARIQTRQMDPRRADPNDPMFDAERGVAFHVRRKNFDEAGWLIFLMTHFGRRPDTRWRRLQDVYGQLGTGIWDWPTVTTNPAAFYAWLDESWQRIQGAFGNHRKYESMRPDSKRPMKSLVEDYLLWIGPGGHNAFFTRNVREAGNDPHVIFDRLFNSLDIRSFGRLAKFDYLSLIGRYGLAPIKAGSAYLKGATGPSRGARLLLDGDPESATQNEALQFKLDALDNRLGVGMVVMEDALCNWQKSPRRFVHFIG